jgi:hypothetical protein
MPHPPVTDPYEEPNEKDPPSASVTSAPSVVKLFSDSPHAREPRSPDLSLQLLREPQRSLRLCVIFSLSTFNFRLSTSPPANSAPNSFSALSANSVVKLFASSSLRFIVDSLNRILLLRALRALCVIFSLSTFNFRLSTS